MGERATNVHDDLTGQQRARLCIITTLIDDTIVELDGFDLLRYAHWTATGQDPDTHTIGKDDDLGPDAATWSPPVQ